MGEHPRQSDKAGTATTLELSVTCQVRGASWHPVYEARLDGASGKLLLREEVAVVQRTGEEWGDVAVTLSTARPLAGIQPPGWSIIGSSDAT